MDFSFLNSMFALWFTYVARTPSFQIVSCYGFSKYIAFATYLDLSWYITCVHRKAWTNLQFGTEGVYCIQLIFPRKKKLFPSFCCLCQWFAILICCVWNVDAYGMWMHIIKSPKSKEEHAFDGCPVVLIFLSRFYMFFFPGPGTWLADCWVDC